MPLPKPINTLLREDDLAYDPWGTALAHEFGIAHTLYWLGENIPSEWRFKPGGMTGLEPPPDYPDCEYVEMIEAGDVTPDDLRYAGTVLSRFVALCARKGRSY